MLFLAPLVGMVIEAKAQEPGKTLTAVEGAPAFTLPALPYAQDALEPYL